jgi:hypothetical protein
MFLPVMKVDWEGLTTHCITSFNLVARILAIILYNSFSELIGLKSLKEEPPTTFRIKAI